jgi:NAD(P)-dependent dehydrogenase (short-subunit alcohol dehydrogenase family)
MAQDMHGKVCLVTGASSGIGKETAVELAKLGATVVAVSRDRVRGEAALAEIRSRSGNPTVELLLGDLGVQSGVRRVAADFREKHDHLHVLVNNAGAAFPDRKLTADGIERTFALNHMGYFLLTDLLLDLLKGSAPARIVNVASVGHKQWRKAEFDPKHEQGFSTFSAYAQSKLANILFTAELGRRLQGTGVTVNCLHPGGVATNIWTAADSIASKLIGILGKPFMLTPAQGAETMVFLASDPSVADVTGQYFYKKRAVRPSRLGQDPALAHKLWELSEHLLTPQESKQTAS